MTRISWATPKMYSRSDRLNCLTEMMSLPYQGAVRWSPKGRWGFFAGLGMAALLFGGMLHQLRRASQSAANLKRANTKEPSPPVFVR